MPTPLSTAAALPKKAPEPKKANLTYVSLTAPNKIRKAENVIAAIMKLADLPLCCGDGS